MRNVDHSSLKDADNCLRYYFFKHVMHLVNLFRQGPLQFGSAIHESMDVFYQGKPLEDAINAFLAVMPLDEFDEPKDIDDKRTIKCGKTIIRDYYTTYEDQPIDEIMSIEKMYNIILKAPWGEEIIYWSKIDKLIRWAYGVTMVDHKTTSYYLSKFEDMVDDTHQYTGYIYTLKQDYPDAHGGLVDAIHVPKPLKTKDLQTQFARYTVSKNDHDFDEWKMWVFDTIERIMKAEKTGNWPQSKSRCHDYNRRCDYIELCRMPINLEEAVHQAMRSGDFKVEAWQPWIDKEED